MIKISDTPLPEPKHGVNENFFALVFVAMAAGFVALLCTNPMIDLAASELAGQRYLRLAIYTGYWAPLVYFVGGRKFAVLEWLKENPVAFAIIVGAIIHGAALVLGK